MGDWELDCDCCKIRTKKIKNETGAFDTFNLDDTLHEKHLIIWASQLASFMYYPTPFDTLDPKSKIGDLTIDDLDKRLDYQLNIKFGQYFHGQSEFKEKWLSPRKFTYDGIDYYVKGNIDGEEDNNTVVELKTTWVTAKYKIKSVIEKAQIQANIYGWIAGYTNSKIIIKNLIKPELNTDVFSKIDTSDIESNLITYIEEHKDLIKKY